MTPCRVLVAEDDTPSREMLVDFLELQGHTVYSAQDGAAAIAIARRFQPDVVLTDICMPGCSGLEVLMQLRRHPDTRSIAVLAMTALSVEELDTSITADFEDVLFKPLELEEIGRRLVAAWDSAKRKH